MGAVPFSRLGTSRLRRTDTWVALLDAYIAAGDWFNLKSYRDSDVESAERIADHLLAAYSSTLLCVTWLPSLDHFFLD